jgi:hypothetical protein
MPRVSPWMCQSINSLPQDDIVLDTFGELVSQILSTCCALLSAAREERLGALKCRDLLDKAFKLLEHANPGDSNTEPFISAILLGHRLAVLRISGVVYLMYELTRTAMQQCRCDNRHTCVVCC